MIALKREVTERKISILFSIHFPNPFFVDFWAASLFGFDSFVCVLEWIWFIASPLIFDYALTVTNHGQRILRHVAEEKQQGLERAMQKEQPADIW